MSSNTLVWITQQRISVSVTILLIGNVNFKCLYKSEVKVSSDEFTVKSLAVSDKTTNIGSLESGFEIHLFTDEDMQNPATNQNIFVGAPIYVSVDWKVTTLTHLAAFYVDKCAVSLGDRSLSIVERNCYASSFGAKLIGQKVVASSAKWQFRSFIVGKSQKTMEMKLVCDIKVCSVDEQKCERNISEKNDQCVQKQAYGYKAN